MRVVSYELTFLVPVFHGKTQLFFLQRESGGQRRLGKLAGDCLPTSPRVQFGAKEEPGQTTLRASDLLYSIQENYCVVLIVEVPLARSRT